MNKVSDQTVTAERIARLERRLRLLPATLTLGALAAITVLSLVAPRPIAGLILIYIFYWFLKTILMSIHLIAGYRAYRRALLINWLSELRRRPKLRRWRDIWHLIIIANAKEDLEIVQATIEAVASSTYPLDRIAIVLANEERHADVAARNQPALRKKFGARFGAFWTTLHPADVVGEVRGKGANISSAARAVLPKLLARGVRPDHVLVTTLDADHRMHPQFLAGLTATYLEEPGAASKSYQPLPMFFNNIWSVPYMIRSVAVGSSFWHMIEATRPYRLRNFAAHSQSLELLIKTDFWSNQTIVEDGHQYWRSLFATGGLHTVVPIFLPIYQDAVLSPKGHLMTYREQYLQKLRWAWGASDIPFVLSRLWYRRREFPLGVWAQAARLVEGHFSWAATSLILTLFGWLPILLNPHFQGTVFSYHFIIFYQRMLLFAMVGMIISLIISRLLLPPRPRHSLTSNDILEWILTPFLLPLTNIVFGALPAIDAQLRLAAGRELGFRVTEKAVTRAALPVHSVQTVKS